MTALRERVARAHCIALVVGFLLVAISQGDVLRAGRRDVTLLWKVPYLVPFVGPTWGALLNNRVR